jgi:hypothetical protein
MATSIWRYAKAREREAARLALLDIQRGRCAGCFFPYGESMFVDHDHDNGRVRGLLCQLCNTNEGRRVADWVGYVASPPATLTRDQCLASFVERAANELAVREAELTHVWAQNVVAALRKITRAELDDRYRETLTPMSLEERAASSRAENARIDDAMGRLDFDVSFNEAAVADLGYEPGEFRRRALGYVKWHVREMVAADAETARLQPLRDEIHAKWEAVFDAMEPHCYLWVANDQPCGFQGCGLTWKDHPNELPRELERVTSLREALSEMRQAAAA